ncbi:hypothetical protein GGD65_006292 [Bradyrhizobium sp. CIR18]|uniref:hypothetical protein n=1 Tax=Bradyrhizobium sp. CIR18 TaxID=2663839 RepID=UPI00160625ED|nr:hypothetical protein [Bradyrhizobium sp. CIR18]MBB4365226.1 hypothetical protein [Bradyrhizobium sp. CIR18]
MTALATAGQAIKLANCLRGIDKAVDAAEFKLKIADLTVALPDIKMAFSEAREEIAARYAQIAELKDQLKRTRELVEYNGYKCDKGPDGAPRGAPYCQVCHQIRPIDSHSRLSQCPELPRLQFEIHEGCFFCLLRSRLSASKPH